MAQINKPNTYFNSVLYTGNGSSNRAITGVGFQPDVVWIKDRNVARSHRLSNSVSGVGKYMYTDLTNAEISAPASGILSFDSDGWTMGNDAGMNSNTETYVAWNWLGGGTASSNTDGTITSSVSANTTSGFSIATYTGTGSAGSFGHGLSGKPDLVIIKNRDAADNWTVIPGNSNLFGGSYYLELNTTGARVANSDVFGSYPSATLNYVSTNHGVNASGENYVCYSFQSIKGFSKIGSYTGNGSTDGTFVYTGFKPAFIIIKATGDTTSWTILDNKRDSYNVTDKRLFTDDSSAEVVSANGNTDFLSNGIKIRTSHLGINTSGGTYIYMAFAEHPFTSSTGTPVTAR